MAGRRPQAGWEARGTKAGGKIDVPASDYHLSFYIGVIGLTNALSGRREGLFVTGPFVVHVSWSTRLIGITRVSILSLMS